MADVLEPQEITKEMLVNSRMMFVQALYLVTGLLIFIDTTSYSSTQSFLTLTDRPKNSTTSAG